MPDPHLLTPTLTPTPHCTLFTGASEVNTIPKHASNGIETPP